MQVRVYYNLTKHTWSIQHKVPGKGWRLLKHADTVTLDNCKPVVYESGRQRVIREKKKYVHAFLTGELSEVHLRRGFRISYNPFKGPEFFYKGSPLREAGSRFDGSRKVTLDKGGLAVSSY